MRHAAQSALSQYRDERLGSDAAQCARRQRPAAASSTASSTRRPRTGGRSDRADRSGRSRHGSDTSRRTATVHRSVGSRHGGADDADARDRGSRRYAADRSAGRPGESRRVSRRADPVVQEARSDRGVDRRTPVDRWSHRMARARWRRRLRRGISDLDLPGLRDHRRNRHEHRRRVPRHRHRTPRGADVVRLAPARRRDTRPDGRGDDRIRWSCRVRMGTRRHRRRPRRMGVEGDCRGSDSTRLDPARPERRLRCSDRSTAR